MKSKNQTDVILNHLLNGETLNINSAYKITKRECNWGSMKLSTRINDYYIPMGLEFKKEMIVSKEGRFMNYTLKPNKVSKKFTEEINE
jgi:hypothetical protein